MDILLSESAAFVLARLQSAGFEAYAVGGCVRDSLMGKKPYDWDIATSAFPEQVVTLFQNTAASVIPTGIKHGTVTVIVERNPVEVTTFRTEQKYSDHRHPDAVSFTSSLQEDLERRDFTINAIAYSPAEGIIDPFHGEQDIHTGIIRCVGRPETRFGEDSLRIMRALRFSSTLGFKIDNETSNSILKNAGLLHYIAQERISAELSKLICGEQILPILLHYSPVIGVFLPEILPAVNFRQQKNGETSSLWERIARSVSCSAPLLPVRLAMLLHDLAEPQCGFSEHAEIGSAIAKNALTRLRYDRNMTDIVAMLVRHHEAPLPVKRKELRHWINWIGEENLRFLLLVKQADSQAMVPELPSQTKQLEQASDLLDRIIREGDCCSLRQLKINGNDLIHAGVPSGPQLGSILHFLLTEVIEERCANERGALLQLAKHFFTDTKR